MIFPFQNQVTGSNDVVYMQLDLGSLKSVRSMAETFLKTEPKLDVLVNNAGKIKHNCVFDDEHHKVL